MVLSNYNHTASGRGETRGKRGKHVSELTELAQVARVLRYEDDAKPLEEKRIVAQGKNFHLTRRALHQRRGSVAFHARQG